MRKTCWVGSVSFGFGIVLAVALFADSPVTAAEPNAAKEDSVQFDKEIRPILQSHCYKCHGAEVQKGGLRLDHRELALKGGDSGALLVPRKSDDSEMFNRITADEEAQRMPPVSSKMPPLSKSEIASVRRWIDSGAVWPTEETAVKVTSSHWSFQPIVRPAVPVLTDVKTVRNPIDAFVQAKLAEKKISPAPEADRYTLIKRLSYDLLGLPPTPSEVDAFVADKSPQAYEKLVDRMLASPHYGERWGRHWLDMARYADSDGYEKDNPRPNAWRYRDWVIQAFNRDLPFDQFTIEQLAGDLLPNATLDQKLATAFHRQTLTNTEGGTDKEQFRVEACFDRVNTTSAVWLGLTAGCAQCHTHKYDPITQAEYYQMFAFFDNGDETELEVPVSKKAVEEYAPKAAESKRQIDAQEQKLAARRAEITAAAAKHEADFVARMKSSKISLPKYHPVEPVSATSVYGGKLVSLLDGSFRAEGQIPDTDLYAVVFKTPERNITGVKLEFLPDEKLPKGGPGLAEDGSCVITEVRLYANNRDDFEYPIERQKLRTALGETNSPKYDPKKAIDGNENTGWRSKGESKVVQSLVVLTEKEIDYVGSTFVKVVISQQYGRHANVGRFRLLVRTGRDQGEGVGEGIHEILTLAASKRTAEQQKKLVEFLLEDDAAGSKLLRELRSLQKDAPASPYLKAAVITQRVKEPRTTHVMRRGDFLQPGQEVPPQTLAVLNSLHPRSKQGKPDRLDLALWLVDPAHPLTTRVTVNHFWNRLFGRGIVSTINDFGTRGDKPSNQQLLDWLATEFQRLGWSRKAMIKTIVLSHTYRQSAAHRPELNEIDPQNTLCARQNRYRVEAEVIRDLTLAASGLLSHKIGGPSVFPPMPGDVAAISYANNFQWKNSTGEDRYRRGMYTFFKRTAPYPSLTTFDCPDFNLACMDRGRSNTPLQALTTLNNDSFAEAAEGFAKRIVTTAGGSDADRLAFAFRTCVARPPQPTEQQELAALLASARDWYGKHPDEASKLTSAHRAEKVAVAESAAWTAVARVLLNLDEFLNRE